MAEIFWTGIHLVSAFDAYKTYESMPVLIYRRVHSARHSASATRRRNAKLLSYAEHGRFGLARR